MRDGPDGAVRSCKHVSDTLVFTDGETFVPFSGPLAWNDGAGVMTSRADSTSGAPDCSSSAWYQTDSAFTEVPLLPGCTLTLPELP